MKSLKSQQQYLIIDPMCDRQPVEFSSDRCNVGHPRCSCNKTCCGVLHTLKASYQAFWNAEKETVAVVQP